MKTAIDAMVEAGFVTACPSGGLTLYNYSQRAVFDQEWNEHTMAARGLVLDAAGRVVARPWPKFFNVGERPETFPDALPAEVPELAEKYDGSLIVCFWNPERPGWQCVTRGCWDNQQTRWANEWIVGRCERFDAAYTYLFELVAPWNRVVLAYAEADMILLGRVHTETGRDSTYAEAATHAVEVGVTPLRFEVRPLSALDLSDTSVTNAEGYVARFSSGQRVKVKYAEYIRLHKLLTGLSVKAIWEGLADGKTDPPDGVPDEFMKWWTGHKNDLVARFDALESRALGIFRGVQAMGLATRKDTAEQFKKTPDLCSALFTMLDGRDHKPVLWKQLRPIGNRVFSAGEP